MAVEREPCLPDLPFASAFRAAKRHVAIKIVQGIGFIIVHPTICGNHGTVVKSGMEFPVKKQLSLVARIGLGLAALAIIAGITFGAMYAKRSGTDLVSKYSGAADLLEPRVSSENLDTVMVGFTPIIEAKGSTALYQIEPISVDPNARYRLSAKVRVLTDDPEEQGARTYVGIATYDAKGALETEDPGPHRYAAASNQTFKSTEGWIEITGFIDGSGKTPQNFRPTTTEVRPMVILNYRSTEAVTQLEYLRLEQVR